MYVFSFTTILRVFFYIADRSTLQHTSAINEWLYASIINEVNSENAISVVACCIDYLSVVLPLLAARSWERRISQVQYNIYTMWPKISGDFIKTHHRFHIFNMKISFLEIERIISTIATTCLSFVAMEMVLRTVPDGFYKPQNNIHENPIHLTLLASFSGFCFLISKFENINNCLLNQLYADSINAVRCFVPIISLLLYTLTIISCLKNGIPLDCNYYLHGFALRATICQAIYHIWGIFIEASITIENLSALNSPKRNFKQRCSVLVFVFAIASQCTGYTLLHLSRRLNQNNDLFIIIKMLFFISNSYFAFFAAINSSLVGLYTKKRSTIILASLRWVWLIVQTSLSTAIIFESSSMTQYAYLFALLYPLFQLTVAWNIYSSKKPLLHVLNCRDAAKGKRQPAVLMI